MKKSAAAALIAPALFASLLAHARKQEPSAIVSCLAPRAALLRLIDPQERCKSDAFANLRKIDYSAYANNIAVKQGTREEVQKFLKEQGFGYVPIKYDNAAAAALRLFFRWEHGAAQADKLKTANGKTVDAIRLDSADGRLMERDGRTMVALKAKEASDKREDVWVVLCTLKEGDVEKGAWRLAMALDVKAARTPTAKFNAVFPMLSVEEKVEMPEFFVIPKVAEAFQITKVFADETGGGVKSAAVVSYRGGPPPRPKADRTIVYGADGKPFLFAILKGDKAPAVAGFMYEGSFKRPPKEK